MSVKVFGKGTLAARRRRHLSIRKKVSGTPEKPRLVVTRSNRNITAQMVDDVHGVTMVSASTLQSGFKEFEGSKVEAAKKVGLALAQKAKAAGICDAVFDRNGYKYHGRVAALAEGAREGGLKI